MSVKGISRPGFVFVDVAPGKEDQVIKHLLQVDLVQEVHLVTGPHDLLVLLEVRRGLTSDSTGAIVDLVRSKIRKIKGVLDTETVISQDRFSPDDAD